MDLQGTGGSVLCADLGARLLCQQPGTAGEPFEAPPPVPLVLVESWRREHSRDRHCNSVSRQIYVSIAQLSKDEFEGRTSIVCAGLLVTDLSSKARIPVPSRSTSSCTRNDSVKGFLFFMAFKAETRNCNEDLTLESSGLDLRYCTKTRAATYKQNDINGLNYKLLELSLCNELVNLRSSTQYG